MSLKPMAIPPVPAETARVARAAFPKGNIYMKLRERVGTIIHSSPAPKFAPWFLSLTY